MTDKEIDLSFISKAFLSDARVKALQKLLRADRPLATGLAGSSAAVLLSALPSLGKAAWSKEPIIVVGDSPDDAGYLYHDISRLLSEQSVAFFPSGYKRDIKYGQEDAPSQIMRTETLAQWRAGQALRMVVTYPQALAEMVASRAEISERTLSLDVGQTVDMDFCTAWLRENGFEEQDYVYEPGHFAVRGSILDVYAYSSELPLRIDFFGDEIDSIRRFSVETQLSEEQLKHVDLTAKLAETAERGISLLEYVSPDTLICARDPRGVVECVRAIANEDFSQSAVISNEGDAHAMERIVDPEAFARDWAAFKVLEFSARRTDSNDSGENASQAPAQSASASLFCDCSPQGVYHKNFDLISDSFKSLIADGYKLLILSDSPNQFVRLRAIFDDRGDDIQFTPVGGTLHEGYVDHKSKVCVFTDHQIFDRFHKYSLKSDRARSGKLAMSLKELNAIEVGDYIVHIDHGIGKFGGLLRTSVSGRMQEMVKLIYQNDDLVFVPIHSLHKLSKYRGKEGVPPKISKLGNGAWNRMKERTKDKLKDIARDLIKHYAARKEEKGFQFSPDSYMQQELEASFIYEDTPDQLTATQAVKADMESPRPMDRLICGDVGFGKTEIAVRAAFKAAADGKQTAVLVPTTVLAYQHFRTFSERLKDFPVRVEYLSRARAPKQVKEILSDLEQGKIDIIIGTHKLIGKSVKFKDLGLLVVDEEQKFGVAVKEKLKQLKVSVDTLTMSATPIPRTLQFSLMGARDLSAINTPPLNRHPIVTSVNAFSEDIISEAINFELARNGQVFFVNPRIEGLYDLEATIRRIVPDARIAVGHGQMPPEKLEKLIVDFAAHEYDVLLSTTIIESGVDMPNVNTMLVNNAHRFGLSELHQLRGRVG
ncbi:MAG: DEAD/DEAH box helicase, partial [Lachnospiraceae bacterium]|nr:DEAD/DEAH box helicase [Lachnospiraceae bacterium]